MGKESKSLLSTDEVSIADRNSESWQEQYLLSILKPLYWSSTLLSTLSFHVVVKNLTLYIYLYISGDHYKKCYIWTIYKWFRNLSQYFVKTQSCISTMGTSSIDIYCELYCINEKIGQEIWNKFFLLQINFHKHIISLFFSYKIFKSQWFLVTQSLLECF